MLTMGVVQSWALLVLILLLVGFVTKPLADLMDRIFPDSGPDTDFEPDEEDSQKPAVSSTEQEKS